MVVVVVVVVVVGLGGLACSHELLSAGSEWHMERGALVHAVMFVLFVFSMSMHAAAGKQPLP